MSEADMAKVLGETNIVDAKIPVYTNLSASATTQADVIRDLLYKQLSYPVRWKEIIENMVASGVENFYEVGPGKVLSGLIKRIDRDVTSSAISDIHDLEQMQL